MPAVTVRFITDEACMLQARLRFIAMHQRALADQPEHVRRIAHDAHIDHAERLAGAFSVLAAWFPPANDPCKPLEVVE